MSWAYNSIRNPFLPVGVWVWVGVDGCVGASVDACVKVCVGPGLQVTPPGLGLHWPSFPHIVVITPSGTNPGSHWNTTTESSVVLVWGCTDPLTGGGGAPLSWLCVRVTVQLSEMKWLTLTEINMDSFSKTACYTIYKFKVCMELTHILYVLLNNVAYILGFVDTGNQGHVQVWSACQKVYSWAKTQQLLCRRLLITDDTKPLLSMDLV